MMEGNQAEIFAERQKGTLPGDLGIEWDEGGEAGAPAASRSASATWRPTASCTRPA